MTWFNQIANVLLSCFSSLVKAPFTRNSVTIFLPSLVTDIYKMRMSGGLWYIFMVPITSNLWINNSSITWIKYSMNLLYSSYFAHNPLPLRKNIPIGICSPNYLFNSSTLNRRSSECLGRNLQEFISGWSITRLFIIDSRLIKPTAAITIRGYHFRRRTSGCE